MTLERISPVKPERPHIVFLFSDTGGGHRSAAKAIMEALELEFPGQTTQEMVDIFKEYAPHPLHHTPEIYPTLSRMPSLYGAGFHISDGPKRTRLFYQIMWPYIRRWMQRLVTEHPADLIVSVHQLINAPMARALAGVDIKTPFVTVVTDLVTTHAAWYSNHADRVIVPTDVAFRRGVKYGVKPERMQVIGLPVADRFCQQSSDALEIRARLGWPSDRTVVLLVGGGEGMGPLELTARAIDSARLPVAMVIIAGRNQKLKQRLEKYAWKTPTIVHGFVQEMPDFMRAADILVTKAGPGTICEAFIAGLPIVMYSRLNGQEEGNVDYVVQNGAGVWAPRPEQVVAALRNWIEHPERRQKAVQVCLRLARPDAARKIAHQLMQEIRVSIP